LASAIHSLISPDGHEVVHTRRRFGPDTPDVEWIGQLGDEGNWIVISGDADILRKKHELEVWKRAKLTTFVFAKGFMNRKFWEQTWIVVRWWPTVMEFAHKVAPGAAFKIPLSYGTGKGGLQQLL